jgi:uncharacterized membrane protein
MFLSTLYDWLMVVHILAAMTWLGGLVAAVALAAAAARQPAALGGFVTSLNRIAPFLFGVPAGVVVLFGILMVVDSSAWGFDQAWIQIAMLLLVASAGLGATVARGAMESAQHALDRGDEAMAARQLHRWSWAIRGVLVLLVLATCDMVLKPGWW